MVTRQEDCPAATKGVAMMPFFFLLVRWCFSYASQLTRYGSDCSYVLHSEAASRISSGRRPSHTLSCNAFMIEVGGAFHSGRTTFDMVPSADVMSGLQIRHVSIAEPVHQSIQDG